MRASIVLLAAASAFAQAAPAQPAGFLPLDPANTLVIDTNRGRIVVAMRPDLAPLAVARITLLAREHVYDGLLFHRVIGGFVDQTGNPNNHDGGVSRHPDLPPEFIAKIPAGAVTPFLSRSDEALAFLGPNPVLAARRDGAWRVWGAYCAGVAGMGRQEGIGTANSEIFFMRAPARYLDHDYTVWGRAVLGLDIIQSITVGEPPSHPDRMVRVRLMADMPAAERPRLMVQDTGSAAFRAAALALAAKAGAAFTPCDVPVETRVWPPAAKGSALGSR